MICPANNDQRKFTRLPFATEVHIAGDEGRWSCQLVDVSLKGALTSIPEKWHGKAGEHFLLEVHLGASDVQIRMEVSVVHVEDDHIGFKRELIDPDSIMHLRRLLELNIGDADLLDRELSELGACWKRDF